MIFWKYKCFTMDTLPHLKHTSVLLDICLILSSSYWFFAFAFWSFFKVELKLNNGTFQIINHLKNSAIPLKIVFENIDKKNKYHIQLFIVFICLFFHFDFKDAIKYTAILSKFLHFLWKTSFPRSDTHPTQVGDMDPWPDTWPNLSDLIGLGQKISSTSW